MCSGIDFGGEPIRWSNNEPRLPVLKKDGSIEWGLWGRPYVSGRTPTPKGPCARLDSIHAGKWRHWHPIPVKIPARSFLERDPKRQEHWFDLAPDQAIQGLLLADGDVGRVYIVTVDAPAEYAHIHDRWPRIILAQHPVIPEPSWPDPSTS